jgi:CO/xanthine dehydrogenase FAD-binding subunit
MWRFEYFAPTSLQEAIGLLEQYQDAGVEVLAAGTDILAEMRINKWGPRVLVSLNSVPGLKGIKFSENEGLRIGALTTFTEIANSAPVRSRFAPISDAASVVGALQIRNRATIGGNICHASPAAEMGAPLLALGASVLVTGPQGERTLPLQEVFAGPGKTSLAPAEILTEILVPTLPAGTSGAYLKFSPRKALDLAVVSVAAVVRGDGDGACSDCRIGLGAVAPTPIRARKAEAAALEQGIAPAALPGIGRLAAEECAPIDDARASAAYRREMVATLVQRAIGQAVGRIG